MKRNKINITAEALIDMFQQEGIWLENKKPLPKDATLLTISANINTNTFSIYYASKKATESAEGSETSIETLIFKAKKFVKRVFK